MKNEAVNAQVMPLGSRFKVIRGDTTIQAFPLSRATTKQYTNQLAKAQELAEKNVADVYLYFMSKANVKPYRRLKPPSDSITARKPKRSPTYYYLHLKKILPKADRCDNPECNPHKPQSSFFWTLKPGRSRSTNPADYMQMCNSCLRRRDITNRPFRERSGGRAKKPVAQYSLSGHFLRFWNSIADAANALKISRSNIGACINHKLAQAGGYKWESKEPI